MTSPVVEARDLSREFDTLEGKLRVLDHLSLTVNPGDRLVLFGPSGCGKTTLLHQLALLDRPSKGTLELKGEDTTVWNESKRSSVRGREIGLVFQQFHLLPYHSVRENLILRQRYIPEKISATHADEDTLLEQVGLKHRAGAQVRHLSGGEQQRLCIARALFIPPVILLADEPTGNLDADNAAMVRKLFADVSGQGVPVVIATHDPSWLSFATRVAEFQRGRLEEQG